MTNVARITVDDRFFEVAAAQSSKYNRLWTIAKETIQNSQDAGADKIMFGIDESEEWVFIADNGPGMGPTGGIDNFLLIGASQKNADVDATGYFSTAKVRICFIHKDWEIKTNDQFLSKSMLNNEPIAILEPPLRGCQFALQSRNGDWDFEEIENYVGLCNPKINVSLNGTKIKRTYRRGQLKSQFGWADAYVNRGKKAHLGLLVVRVNGLAMFTQSLYNVKAQVTLELDPALSHKVLQENREALVWRARLDDGSWVHPHSALNKFVSGLIINPSSVKPSNKTIIEFVQGSQRAVSELQDRFGPSHIINAEPAQEVDVSPTRTIVHDTGAELIKSGALSLDDLMGLIVNQKIIADRPGLPIQVEDSWTWGDEDRMPDNIRLEWTDQAPPTPLTAPAALMGGQAQVVDSMPDPKLLDFQAIFPYDYVIKHEGYRPALHTKHARVLAAWKSLLDELSAILNLGSNFGVGLCIDQDVTAEFAETPHGDFFLIDYREFKSTGGQLPQTMKMIRSACHELTHAKGNQDHDEAFIVEETRIFDVAMEMLSALRTATKGLTVYSRGYGKKNG